MIPQVTPAPILTKSILALFDQLVDRNDLSELDGRIVSSVDRVFRDESVERKDLKKIVDRNHCSLLTNLYYERKKCQYLNGSGKEVFFPNAAGNSEARFPFRLSYTSFSKDFFVEYYNYTKDVRENFIITELDRDAVLKKVEEVKDRLQLDVIAKIRELAGKDNVKGPIESKLLDSWDNFKEMYTLENFAKGSNYIVTYTDMAFAGDVVVMHELRDGKIVSFPVMMPALEYMILNAKTSLTLTI